MAYADAVRRNPLLRRRHRVLSGPPRSVPARSSTASGSGRCACRGTYFQMLDYSAITGEPDADVCDAARRASTASRRFPISPFLQPGEDAGPGAALLLRQARRDAGARGRALAARVGRRRVQVGQVRSGGENTHRESPRRCSLPRRPRRRSRCRIGRRSSRRRAPTSSARRRRQSASPTSNAGASCTRTRSDGSGAAPAPRSTAWSRNRTAVSRARSIARDGKPVTGAPTTEEPAADACLAAVRGGRHGRGAAISPSIAASTHGGRDLIVVTLRAQAGCRPADPRGAPGQAVSRQDLRGRGRRRGGARGGDGHRGHHLRAGRGGAAQQGRHRYARARARRWRHVAADVDPVVRGGPGDGLPEAARRPRDRVVRLPARWPRCAWSNRTECGAVCDRPLLLALVLSRRPARRRPRVDVDVVVSTTSVSASFALVAISSMSTALSSSRSSTA